MLTVIQKCETDYNQTEYGDMIKFCISPIRWIGVGDWVNGTDDILAQKSQVNQCDSYL